MNKCVFIILKYSLLLLLFIYLFILYGRFTCLHICVPHVCLVFFETRRRFSRSEVTYRWWWATMWMLPGPPEEQPMLLITESSPSHHKYSWNDKPHINISVSYLLCIYKNCYVSKNTCYSFNLLNFIIFKLMSFWMFLSQIIYMMFLALCNLE